MRMRRREGGGEEGREEGKKIGNRSDSKKGDGVDLVTKGEIEASKRTTRVDRMSSKKSDHKLGK